MQIPGFGSCRSWIQDFRSCTILDPGFWILRSLDPGLSVISLGYLFSAHVWCKSQFTLIQLQISLAQTRKVISISTMCFIQILIVTQKRIPGFKICRIHIPGIQHLLDPKPGIQDLEDPKSGIQGLQDQKSRLQGSAGSGDGIVSKDSVYPVSRPQSFCLMLRSFDVVSLFYRISKLLDLVRKKFTESGGYSVFQETLMNLDHRRSR